MNPEAYPRELLALARSRVDRGLDARTPMIKLVEARLAATAVAAAILRARSPFRAIAGEDIWRTCNRVAPEYFVYSTYFALLRPDPNDGPVTQRNADAALDMARNFLHVAKDEK